MKKIVWEKWYDVPPEDIEKKVNTDIEEEEDEEGSDFDEESSGLYPLLMSDISTINHPQIISTPIGRYKENDNMLPTKMFDCWICHTNFDLTNGNNGSADHISILEQVPGVEALKIMTRYRFFVGVGKLFSIRDVRVDIAKALCATQKDGELESDWAAFISEEGESYTISASEYPTREEYEDHLAQLKAFTNGRLFISQKV